MSAETDIAKIDRTFLGFEDHGYLTATLNFDYGHSGQGMATRVFGSVGDNDGPEWTEAHARGMDFVRRVLLACGVDGWEKLVGRTVLVTHTYIDILKIEPLPTERGTAFDIEAWAEASAL